MERKGFLIGKAFNKYLWASILTVAASQVASIIDGALVGNIIGADGLAAVVISRPILQAIFAISCLYVASCTIITGMALGGGDREKANSLFSFSMAVSVVLGLLISIGGVIFIDPLMDLFCQSEELMPMAKAFMTVTLLTALPMLLMYTLQQFVTVDGSPRLVSRAVIVGNIVNVCLDVVFMKYMDMGIAGAAWATFIMCVVCCLMVIPHFSRKDTLRLQWGKLKQHIQGGQIMTLGMPLFLSTVLISVQFACYNNIATTYMGQFGLVALAVCMQLLSFSMIILTGCLRTIQPVGAVLRGIGDNHGMMILLGKGYRFMAVGLVIYTLLIVFFPTEISALLGVKDAAAAPTLTAALPAFTLNIIMQALLYNLMPIYQFYGHNRMALFLSVAQTLLPIVGFWALSSTFNFQLSTFNFQLISPWYGFFLGQLLTAIILLVTAEIIRRKPEVKAQNLAPVFLIPRGNEFPSMEFSFGYSDADMHTAFDNLSAWLKNQNLPESVIFKVRIIAEELMSNITRHSQQKDKAAFADVRIVVNSSLGGGREGVTLALTDDGKPFNPIENKDKGYGLMIANGAASDISYKYQFGQNMTTVKVYQNDSIS